MDSYAVYLLLLWAAEMYEAAPEHPDFYRGYEVVWVYQTWRV